MRKNSQKKWRALLTGCAGIAAAELSGMSGIARGDALSTWDGGNGNWSDSAHWIPAIVPNNGNNGTNYAVVVTAGALNLNIPITIDPFTFSGGNISGTSTLNALQLFTWTGGTFGTGGGTMTAGGGMSITGVGTKVLIGGRVVNTGAGTWSGAGNINMQSGAVLENRGSFAVSNDAVVLLAGGILPTFANSGTFTKSSTSGTGTTDINVFFNNSGTVAVTSGVLNLSNGGTDNGGSWAPAAGGTVRLTSGTFTFGGAATGSGAGIVDFNGAVVVVNGSFANAAQTRLSGGNLDGSGVISTSGLFTWSGGSFNGGGGTMTAGGGMSLTGSSAKTINAYHLVNTGPATWGGLGNITMGSAATIDNRGTFNIINDSTLSYAGGGAPAVINSGVITKSSVSGTGVTDIGAFFGNSGTMAVTSGLLNFSAGGTDIGGSWSPSAGGTVRLSSGPFTFGGTTIGSGAGTVEFGGAGVVENGSFVNAAKTLLSSGSFGGSGTLSANGLLTWTGGSFGGGGGTVTANGGLVIAGSANKFMNAYRLINNGSGTWGGAGSLYFQGGSVLDNRGTFNATNDASIVYKGGVQSMVLNSGVFNKSSVSGTGVTDIVIPFNNSGTVNVNSGVLSLSAGGTDTGTAWTLSSGGTARLSAGTFTFNGAATGSGAGTLEFGEAAVVENGSFVNAAKTLLSSGSFSGSGTLSANGLLTWTGGSFGGGGTTTANGGLVIGGSINKLMTAYRLINIGSGTWGGAGNLYLQSASVLENRGTFNATNDASVFYNGGVQSTVLNSGVFNKSSVSAPA